ncbi:MAG TPA: holo-ACP synthase [Dehalococcoidia bacterium]|nr:holo-ACP synthase [Dehalococcoidia bacterium]
MGHAVGVDIIEIDRIEATLARHGQRFLKRVYTPLEIAYCRGKSHRLAGRFAAKEATMKALGTGVRGVSWRDVEVIPNRRGKPLLYLHGGALARAREIKLHDAEVSLTHSSNHAMAVVMATVDTPEEDRAAWRLRYREIMRQRGLLP